MKILFALTLLFTTFTSAHAIPLLEAVREPGFEANPQQKRFRLENTGKMTLFVKNLRDNTQSTIQYGQLSRAAMQGIIRDMGAISSRSRLIDQEPTQPMCTDAPAISTFAYIGALRLEIHRRASCHTWLVNEYQAQNLSAFAESILGL